MHASSESPQQNVRRLIDIILRSPREVANLTTGDLDLTLRIARRARLLGRLAVDLRAAGVYDALPRVARDQLDSFEVMADSRTRVARWELNRIAWALQDEQAVSLTLMKGCTYVLLELPNARGRIFADVDILLPEDELERVEALLNQRGWRSTKLTPYDQNYYRKWTHELPPLVHVEREVEVDLHHNVVPRTSRLKPCSKDLLNKIRPVAETPFHALADEDIVLHAMTHLMFDGDLADSLRDLVDIDELLRYFVRKNSNFWDRLVERAVELNLARPAYYSLRYVKRLLGCPVPDAVIDSSRKWAPPSLIVGVMDRLVPRALFPRHPDYPSRLTDLSRLLLYMRSHWIRMPPWLLAYHLSYKFFATRFRHRNPAAP